MLDPHLVCQCSCVEWWSAALASQAFHVMCVPCQVRPTDPSASACQLQGVTTHELLPVPALRTPCGVGLGVAVCSSLGVIVTSDWVNHSLLVWALPIDSSAAWSHGGEVVVGLRLMCILGGLGSAPPMVFRFCDRSSGGRSGYLAFTPPTVSDPALLLVSDAGHGAVHLVDVARQTHVGYLAPPRSINGPRGVATSSTAPLAAVSTASAVHLYRGSGTVWVDAQVIECWPLAPTWPLGQAFGLRFSLDGATVAVADHANNRVSLFRVAGGGLVRHIDTGVGSHPIDVEEAEGGWLVVCERWHAVGFLNAHDGYSIWRYLGRADGAFGAGDGEFRYPASITTVPGLGVVVVRELEGARMQVFVNRDTLSMASMSFARVAWMVGVARGVKHRRQRALLGS
jgi:hypothetical protein